MEALSKVHLTPYHHPQSFSIVKLPSHIAYHQYLSSLYSFLTCHFFVQLTQINITLSIDMQHEPNQWPNHPASYRLTTSTDKSSRRISKNIQIQNYPEDRHKKLSTPNTFNLKCSLPKHITELSKIKNFWSSQRKAESHKEIPLRINKLSTNPTNQERV
jgi:hypothetical protein